MKAYRVNGTEYYAANDFGQAESLHDAECGGLDPATIIEMPDPEEPWREDGSSSPTTTLGEVVARTKEPAWIGSTEA